MKTTVLRYGKYAFACAALLFTIILYVGQGLDFTVQEILGYFTIFTSLAFVFFGIKHFRDIRNGGVITLKKAIAIGVLISVFAAVGLTLADTIYVTLINPDFAEQYYEYSLDKMASELPPEEFETRKQELGQKVEQYKNPAFNAVVMFLTVFVIGFLVSLVSAIILRRN